MFLSQGKHFVLGVFLFFFSVVARHFSKPHPRTLEGHHIFLALYPLGSDVFVNYFSSQEHIFLGISHVQTSPVLCNLTNKAQNYDDDDLKVPFPPK